MNIDFILLKTTEQNSVRKNKERQIYSIPDKCQYAMGR